jgi:hypothetical protein
MGLAPHQLRHAHAIEMSREGISLLVIQRQLGHADLAITSRYLRGIDNSEIIAAVHERPRSDDPRRPEAHATSLTPAPRTVRVWPLFGAATHARAPGRNPLVPCPDHRGLAAARAIPLRARRSTGPRHRLRTGRRPTESRISGGENTNAIPVRAVGARHGRAGRSTLPAASLTVLLGFGESGRATSSMRMAALRLKRSCRRGYPSEQPGRSE